MKIAFVYDLLYPVTKGGVEKRIWEVGRRLATRGHDVHLFPTGYWGRGTVTTTADGVSVHGVGRPRALHTRRGRRSVTQATLYALALPGALRREEFDVIDCQAPAHLACMSGAVTARRQATAAAVVVTWHEVWQSYWEEYLGRFGRLARELERCCGRVAGHHVAVSSHTGARLGALGVQRHSVVPNGVDLGRVAGIRAARTPWDVVAVARFTHEKNLGLLLDALGLLQRRGRLLRTAIIGDGPEGAALRQKAGRLRLDQVTFIGRLERDDDVLAHMSAARLFALPSIREGFGIAVLEAAACGVPAVTVDHAHNAAKALVRPGVDGFVTAARPEAFAHGLEAVLDAPHSIRMSLAARQKAGAYSWERTVDELEEVYRTAGAGIVSPQMADRA